MANIYDIVLSICIIVAISQYHFWKTDKLVIIGLLLILTGFVEFTGKLLSSKSIQNEWLYNIFFVIEFTFFVIAIIRKISNQLFKKNITIVYFVYIFSETINILFFQKITQFHLYTFTMGSFVIVTASGLFLYELISNTEEDFYREPFFWICTGLLFFYSGNFLLMSSLNYVNINFKGLAKKLFLITELLSILEYFLFIIAFLCKRIFRISHLS